MRTYFQNLADVMQSPLAAAARTLRPGAGQHRVLKSTRLEDMVYQGLRRDDPGLDALESSGAEKLSTFPALSRDIYQSFYSLNVKKNEPPRDGSSRLMKPPASLSRRLPKIWTPSWSKPAVRKRRWTPWSVWNKSGIKAWSSCGSF